ncbi:DUF2437 domain-containing protein [candidate division KSB1 bacterium]|nr:DUF2437 domain-containing protein [candidate division KSB1 bacterium]
MRNLTSILILITVTLVWSQSKIARYRTASGESAYGLVISETLQPLEGDFNDLVKGQMVKIGSPVPLAAVQLLPPVIPSKMINFGVTFNEPGQSGGITPLMFFKPPSALIGHEQDVIYPHHISNKVVFEAELALVIGQTCYRITPEQAKEVVFGYTCHNDLTASDLTSADPAPARGKSVDTFAPLGPWIVTDIDASDLEIQLWQNGELKQNSRTSQMTYDIFYLVSLASQGMTLYPGDVIALGTPPGVGETVAGDTLTVKIEKIGSLVNIVR